MTKKRKALSRGGMKKAKGGYTPQRIAPEPLGGTIQINYTPPQIAYTPQGGGNTGSPGAGSGYDKKQEPKP